MKYVFKEYDLEKVDLKVLLERYIKEITSKETSVKDLAMDKETVYKLKRAYDTKECIEYLLELETYDCDSELKARINNYGIKEVFAKLYSDDSDIVNIYLAECFYGWYSDDWLEEILTDLQDVLPLDESEL